MRQPDLRLSPTPARALVLALFAACAPSDFDRARDKHTDPACVGDASDEALPCDDRDDDDALPDGALDSGEHDASAELPEAGEPPTFPEPDGDVAVDAEPPAPCDDCEPDAGSEDAATDADTVAPPTDGGIDTPPDASRGCAMQVCTPNQLVMETRACGACSEGTQTRARACASDGCSLGPFSAWSECVNGETECMPNATESQMRSCGICNLGTQKRTRTCSAQTCGWSEWGAWSTCSAVSPPCMPGQVETQRQSCGACNTGTQTRTRTCSNGCAWGSWSAWSGCGGVTAACTPGQTTACSPNDDCGHRVCSNSCKWGGCVPKTGNTCLRRRNGTQEQGSNYRCCGNGRWQFCLPDCRWSAECSACSPSNCEC